MGLLSNEDRRTCIGAACRLGFGQGVLQGVLASEDAYKARWVESEWKGADQGKIEITSGAHSSDPEFDRALKTTQDYRWYDVSAKMDGSSTTRTRPSFCSTPSGTSRRSTAAAGTSRFFRTVLTRRNSVATVSTTSCSAPISAVPALARHT